jgi:hypothetical protein
MRRVSVMTEAVLKTCLDEPPRLRPAILAKSARRVSWPIALYAP